MELLPHVIILGLVGFIVTISWSPTSSLFSWHPTLMSVAFLGLQCESILLFHPRFSPVTNHALRVKLHQIFQIVGFVLGSIGMVIIYILKENAGKPHISSWHALFGLSAMILTLIQLVGGLPLIYSQIRKILPMSKSLGELKRKHAQMGLITVICGLTTVGLAFYSNWFIKKEFHRIYQNVAFGAVTTIIGVLFAQVYHGRLSVENQN
ncbi:transmembrane reductase CYB561D2-like [Bolinopsis microptera]|uniref:transmembrane reductase CYB561D2-like n=1 Tax=Bolinopsis microptera TaxID=2820187 RepID=UPI00307A6AE2